MRARITEAHLARKALVYVRQSTAVQLRLNIESRRMQYALTDRAKGLGFSSVEVIDEDLGCSASGAAVRKGFEHLAATVGAGRAGAVFCIEASRLARNNREWHRLLHLCASPSRSSRSFESVRQTLVWFRQEGIELPVKKHASAGWTTAWRPASYDLMRRMLTHPAYAGAYAFGINVRMPGTWRGSDRPRIRRSSRPEDWKRLILGRHEAYISWERYRKNVALITANARLRGGERIAVGKCLLSTLMHCGRCGRTIRTQFDGGRRRGYHRCYCLGTRDISGGQRCMDFSGPKVESSIMAALSGALSEGLREAASREPVKAEILLAERRTAAELALKDARRRETRCAALREAADPGNTYVMKEAETRWESAIRARLECERRMAKIEEEAKSLDSGYRRRLRDAARDFRFVWDDPRIGQEARRAAIRAVLDDIVIEWENGAPTYKIRLCWRGGGKTEITLRKYRRGVRHGLAGEISSLVANLSRNCPPSRVAAVLNRAGRLTASGKPWTQGRVSEVLRRNCLPDYFSKENVEFRKGSITLQAAADQLGVSFMAAHRLARSGHLPATQAVSGATWRVMKSDLGSETVRREVARIKGRRKGFGGGVRMTRKFKFRE